MKKITIGNHLTLYLLTLCVLLAGVLWIQNQNIGKIQQDSSPKIQSELKPPARGSVSAPNIATFSEIVERPLFIIGRQPPPKPTPAPTAPVRVAPLSAALEGVIITPSEEIAVIFDFRKKEILNLSKGMVYQGWELTDISGTTITFTRGQQSQQLTLEEPQ